MNFAALACMEDFQAPGGTLSPGSDLPTLALPSRANAAADAVIVSGDHAEEISDGTLSQCTRISAGWSVRTCRRLRHGLGKVPVDWSGMPLRQGCASRRNCQRRAHLLDTSGDVGEGEGALFVAGFEIDAALVKFDFLQMVAGVGGALRAVGNCCGGGF